MVRLILIIENDSKNLEIGEPRTSLVKLKEKNAVVIDLPVNYKKNPIFKVKDLAALAVNDRQNSFLSFLTKKAITNREYRQFFKNKITAETARLDLLALEKLGLLSKKGERKGTIYYLNENFIGKP